MKSIDCFPILPVKSKVNLSQREFTQLYLSGYMFMGTALA